MARGSKIKKVTGKRGVSYRTTVDVGTDPATGKRKQKVLTAKTKQELEVLVAQTLADVSRNVYFEPAKMTVGEYLDYWLKNTNAKVEPTTYQGYEIAIRLHLKPAFGAIPLTKLTPAHVQEFLTTKAESGLAPNTVSRYYEVLNHSMNHAVKWEIIPRNVCNSVDKPKVAKKEADPLTVEQSNIIITALKGTYHEKITKVTMHTGARIGEILALRWDDVHLDGDDPYVIVSHGLKTLKGGVVIDGAPKGKKPRRIDLEPEAVAVLRARHREQVIEKLAIGPAYQEAGYVFCRPDGARYNPKSYGNCWSDAVLYRTGIDAHIHQVRHTAATLMLEAGVPLHEVSRMLGHASVAITGDIYGHVLPSGRREASRKLAESLAAGRK
ncbi:MAG: site-specific integrase [Peptococcaceae bacterium]|jgi:integrase|nr:site-specific integrase [Peptococcaceae bacterium]